MSHRFAVAIGTYASIPYVHLHLELHKRVSKNLKCLVHDDCSADSSEIKRMCSAYGAEFVSTDKHMAHTLGDLSCFVRGIRWAKELDVEYLVKFSRRFIPLRNWADDADSMIDRFPHHTYSNISVSHGFGFRTEAIVLDVQEWSRKCVMEELSASIMQGKPVFVERFMHQVAQKINSNHALGRRYDEEQGRPEECRGYGVWDFIGNDRSLFSEKFLWHDACHAEHYAIVSAIMGLGYRKEDFDNVAM